MKRFKLSQKHPVKTRWLNAYFQKIILCPSQTSVPMAHLVSLAVSSKNKVEWILAVSQLIIALAQYLGQEITL